MIHRCDAQSGNDIIIVRFIFTPYAEETVGGSQCKALSFVLSLSLLVQPLSV